MRKTLDVSESVWDANHALLRGLASLSCLTDLAVGIEVRFEIVGQAVAVDFECCPNRRPVLRVLQEELRAVGLDLRARQLRCPEILEEIRTEFQRLRGLPMLRKELEEYCDAVGPLFLEEDVCGNLLEFHRDLERILELPESSDGSTRQLPESTTQGFRRFYRRRAMRRGDRSNGRSGRSPQDRS